MASAEPADIAEDPNMYIKNGEMLPRAVWWHFSGRQCVGRGGCSGPGDTPAARAAGEPWQSRPGGLWGQSGVWVSGTGQTPISPLCVLLHGPAPLGVSPHLHAPHRQGCLETDDSIWAACLSSGAGLGGHLVMMQGSGTPLTPPACPSESLTPPVSSRHRGSLWLHAPSRSCVILPSLCEGELWPVGRMVVLSLCACTW